MDDVSKDDTSNESESETHYAQVTNRYVTLLLYVDNYLMYYYCSVSLRMHRESRCK